MGVLDTTRLSAIGIVLLAFVYIGWTYRTRDPDAFHTGSRATGLIQCIATIFTVVGAPHFAIFTTLAYLFGWWAVSFYIGTIFGFVVLSILTGRIRRYVGQNAHTFTDIAAAEVGRRFSFLLFLIGLLFTTGVVVAQLVIGAQLLSKFAGLSYAWCVTLIMATIAIYLLQGGYKALVNTDVVQGVIMFVFTALLLIFVLQGLSPEALFSPAVRDRGGDSMVPFVPLLFLAGVLAICGSPEIWQRVLNASDDATARTSLITAGVTMLCWGIMVVSIGLTISLLAPKAPPGTAFVEFLTSGLPPYMIGIVCVLIIAAIMSTADTDLFASTILLRTEWCRLNGKSNPQQFDIATSRWIIGALSVVMALAAIVLTDLQELWGVLLNLVYISAPLVVAVILGRGGVGVWKKWIYIASLVCSVVAFIYVAIAIKNYFSWWALLIIGLASIPLLVPGKVNASLGNTGEASRGARNVA